MKNSFYLLLIVALLSSCASTSVYRQFPYTEASASIVYEKIKATREFTSRTMNYRFLLQLIDENGLNKLYISTVIKDLSINRTYYDRYLIDSEELILLKEFFEKSSKIQAKERYIFTSKSGFEISVSKSEDHILKCYITTYNTTFPDVSFFNEEITAQNFGIIYSLIKTD